MRGLAHDHTCEHQTQEAGRNFGPSKKLRSAHGKSPFLVTALKRRPAPFRMRPPSRVCNTNQGNRSAVALLGRPVRTKVFGQVVHDGLKLFIGSLRASGSHFIDTLIPAVSPPPLGAATG